MEIQVDKKPWEPVNTISFLGGKGVSLLGNRFLPFNLCSLREGFSTPSGWTDSDAYLKPHTSPILCASFSNDGAYLVTSAEDKSLKVWQCSDWSCVVTAMCAKKVSSFAMHTALTSNSYVVVWCDRTGAVYRTDLPTLLKAQEEKEREKQLANEGGEAKEAAKDAADDANDKAEPNLLLGHCSWVTTMLLSRSFIITGDRDRKLRVSSYPEAYNIVSFCLGHTTFVTAMAFLSTFLCEKPQIDPQFIVSGGGDATLYLWDFAKGDLRQKLSLLEEGGIVRNIVVIDDDLLAVSIEGQSSVYLVSVSSENGAGIHLDYVTSLSVETQMILSLSVFEHNALFVSTLDQGVKIYSLQEKTYVDYKLSLTFVLNDPATQKLSALVSEYFLPPPEMDTEDKTSANFDSLKNRFSMSYLLTTNYKDQEKAEKPVDGDANSEKLATKKRKKRLGGKPVKIENKSS